MPVKQNKDVTYDIVVKSLRRRQVSCRVPAVTPPKKSNQLIEKNKTEEALLENKPSKEADEHLEQKENASSESKCYPKKELSASKENENPKSPVSVEETALITPIATKRPYRRRTVNISHIAKRWSNSEPDLDDNAVFSPSDEKRPYQKKQGIVLEFPKTNNAKEGVTTPNSILATPIRTYSRKTPVVPLNTPVIIKCDLSPGCKSAPPLTKRKRGRPVGQKRPPLVFPSEDEESTCSVVSQNSQERTLSRRSRKLWYLDLEEESQDEPISEYELQRQRNIEENMKMLRQIFNEKGLEFEEKSSSSDTPRAKKVYNRLPLPPPRPKSARLEDRRSMVPLDFSRLSQHLSLVE